MKQKRHDKEKVKNPETLVNKGTEKLPFFSGSFSFFYNTMSEIMIH